MSAICVTTETLTQFPLLAIGGVTLVLRNALDDDVPGQQTHFRSLVHVVGKVPIVTVLERPLETIKERVKLGFQLFLYMFS